MKLFSLCLEEKQCKDLDEMVEKLQASKELQRRNPAALNKHGKVSRNQLIRLGIDLLLDAMRE